MESRQQPQQRSVVLLVAVIRADGWAVGGGRGGVAGGGRTVGGAFGTSGRVGWGGG